MHGTDEHSNCEREGSPRVASGAVVAWQHINLHGEYDFAAEKLQDSVGLEVPQNPSVRGGLKLGVCISAQTPEATKVNRDRYDGFGTFV